MTRVLVKLLVWPVRSWFCALAALCLAAPVQAGPAYPLKVSANGRYLVDQNGVPFLLNADTPQKMVRNCSSNDVVFYLQNRATNGFNALQCMFAFDEWDNYGGALSAFNSTLPGGYPDFKTPNTNFWNYVAWITDIAASNGICMFWCPTETGTQLPAFRANGTNACYQYGQFIGNFFKSRTNIVWMHGNDHQTWTNASDDALILAVARGIASVDTNHLQTVILNYFVSLSTDDLRWWPYLGLNCNYDYSPQYANTARAYTLTNLPVFLGEGHYVDETTGGPWQEPTTDLLLRHQQYWTLLSGGCGQIFGTAYGWTFDPGWQSHLNTPEVAQVQHALTLFTNRAWFNLVPDLNHALLVSGQGQWNTNTLISENSFATAAFAPDGTLGLIYSPNNAGRVLTVNLGAFTNVVRAQWFDPVSGALADVAGSPFTNAGLHDFTRGAPNAGGDEDWVLLLEAEAAAPAPLAVMLLSPTNGAVVSNYVNMAAVVTNDQAGAVVQFQIDGANFGGALDGPPYALIWQTQEHDNGLHRISAIARDASSRLATNTVSVLVSNSLPAVPTDALVAAYGFDEGQGTTAGDASGEGNTGTIQGATWTSAGRYGKALAFDGASRMTVNDSSSLDLVNGLTLTAWVYPTTSASWSTVIMKERGKGFAYALYAAGFHGNPPSAIFYSPTQTVVNGPDALVLNMWTHLAATFDGSSCNLHVNGVLVASQPVTGALVSSTGSLRIGGNSIWGEYFTGLIDELRIYNRALTPAEISADLQTPTTMLPQVTLATYPQSAGQIATNGFRFYLNANLPVSGTIEYSTNLVSWASLSTFVYTNNPIEIIDMAAGASARRYYRVAGSR